MRAWRGCSAARPRFADRGSASVWVLALVPLLLAATAAVGAVAQAVAVRQGAQAAADLAATAAARGGPIATACARAGAIAGANGVRMVTCRLGRGGAQVAVHAAGRGWVAWVGGVTVTGRSEPPPARLGLGAVPPGWGAGGRCA